MQSNSASVQSRRIEADDPRRGTRLDGAVFTGNGTAVVSAVAAHAGIDGLAVLKTIVHELLVSKGADWTAAILGDYLQLYDDSLGTFSLVWDDRAGRLVSHGSIFQATFHPAVALLAHIRTADAYRGLGLGTMVTEEVTSAAFRQQAEVVVLATDDKLHRIDRGEQAAHSMYSRIGYAMLGEAKLADTVDWLMVIDEPTFREVQREKSLHGGRFPTGAGTPAEAGRQALIEQTYDRFAMIDNGLAEAVTIGDLPSLFLLLNLHPAGDFALKLASWQVQHGPELERNFIATLRQAIVDQDRLQDASLVLRDGGVVKVVCAAQQQVPFTRQTYAIDFYCLPALLNSHEDRVRDLVERTIERIRGADTSPCPCWLSYIGLDEPKIRLFKSLGFAESDQKTTFVHPGGQDRLEAREYSLQIK